MQFWLMYCKYTDTTQKCRQYAYHKLKEELAHNGSFQAMKLNEGPDVFLEIFLQLHHVWSLFCINTIIT